MQLRKLASSGSAETSGDLHLSEHCGDQQRVAHHHITTQTKHQDVQTRDVATKLSHVELHVEDLAHAESVQDQIMLDLVVKLSVSPEARHVIYFQHPWL